MVFWRQQNLGNSWHICSWGKSNWHNKIFWNRVVYSIQLIAKICNLLVATDPKGFLMYLSKEIKKHACFLLWKEIRKFLNLNLTVRAQARESLAKVKVSNTHCSSSVHSVTHTSLERYQVSVAWFHPLQTHADSSLPTSCPQHLWKRLPEYVLRHLPRQHGEAAVPSSSVLPFLKMGQTFPVFQASEPPPSAMPSPASSGVSPQWHWGWTFGCRNCLDFSVPPHASS